MPFIRCPTPADAIAAWERVAAEAGDALFLCFASEDPATGLPWCPDCVTADPVLRAAIAAQAPGLPCYECPVGERAAWKNQPAHPFRTHPGLRLARIPTLIRVRRGIEIGRLVEGPCAEPAAVRAFLA